MIVEDLDGDPRRVRGDPDGTPTGVAAHHHAHGPRAVAAHVGRSGRVLPVRVVPAVGPAAPAAGQVWVGDVDAGVHVRDHDPLTAISEIPQRGRVDQGHVRL